MNKQFEISKEKSLPVIIFCMFQKQMEQLEKIS